MTVTGFKVYMFLPTCHVFCSGLKVVGFAMYYFTYDPWVGKQLYLEDFYVMEPYRGTALFTSCFFIFSSWGLSSDLCCSCRDGHRFGGPATPEQCEWMEGESVVEGKWSRVAWYFSQIWIYPGRTESCLKIKYKCASFNLLFALPAGHKDALHRHDVCGGGEQWALHQVL